MTKYRKIKNKRSILKTKLFWIILISLIILIGICYLLFLSPVFKIKSIEVIGVTKYLNVEEIKTKTKQIVPQNILFLNKGSIRESLLKEYLMLDNVKVVKKLPSRVEILIEERKPVANYCFEQKCYYLDKKGISFKEIETQDGLYITLIPEKSEDNVFPNVISEELLNQSLLAKDEIRKIVGVNVLECKFFDLKLEMETDQGWLAILNPKGDIKNQVSNLNLVFKNRIGEENAQNINYIDVRLDKIFYMMK